MNKLIIGLLGATAIIGGSLWFQPQLLTTTGLDITVQNAYFSIAGSLGRSNNKKCTTASGEVIYGSISKPDDCVKIESIDTHITIVERETPEEGNYLSRKPLRSTENSYCDGRTHCSQMSSCAEARFFLANCSGMKVDGDQDGTPCEKQWCN